MQTAENNFRGVRNLKREMYENLCLNATLRIQESLLTVIH